MWNVFDTLLHVEIVLEHVRYTFSSASRGRLYLRNTGGEFSQANTQKRKVRILV